MGNDPSSEKKLNVYSQILTAIFERHWTEGAKSFEFDRDELREVAKSLGLAVSNLGDILYSFRYRNALPVRIANQASEGYEWIIEGVGQSRYAMKQVKLNRIVPREDLVATKIPDATPEIIVMHAKSDEQALLAQVRYNRLIDIFLGIASYSLQNHLRTTVAGIGQIEVDEVYVGIDKSGAQYVIPVQAKLGNDQHSVVQTSQDIACCAEKFPNLVCRAISAQFMRDRVIALFELTLEEAEVKVLHERHYQLVPSSSISDEDLQRYRNTAVP